MQTNNENVIEFITGDDECCASFTNRRYANRIQKLYEQRKDDFKYLIVNKDGSVTARFPLNWVKINPPREYSEEQRQELRERFIKNVKSDEQ